MWTLQELTSCSSGSAKARAAGKHKRRPVSIDAAEVKGLSNEISPGAIAKKLGIARSATGSGSHARDIKKNARFQLLLVEAMFHQIADAHNALQFLVLDHR